MFLALCLLKSGLFFKDCFVANEKVCFSSLSLGSLSETSFLSKRRVFELSPFRHTISKWFHLPHLREVWPYAEQAVLPPWWGYFDPFCFISVSPDCCCVTFSHVIWQTQRVPSSRFEFLFSLRRPRLPPGHFIFYCGGPGFSEFHGLSSVLKL